MPVAAYRFRLAGDPPGSARWTWMDPTAASGPAAVPAGCVWYDGPHQKAGVIDPAAPVWERPRAVPRTARPTPPAERGRCAYLGDLVETVPGCRGGRRCKFECDHPNPAKRVAGLVVPAGNCQTCPHWSDHVQPEEVAADGQV